VRAARALLGLLVGCLLVLTGGPARAHTGSYDMKYVDGANLVLLTFNTHQPVSGLAIAHNIRLYDLVGAPILYDQVHVEIRTQTKGSGVSDLESTLREEATLPMLATNESELTYRYPGPGPYTLSVEFTAGGRTISRGHFAIDIGKGAGPPVDWLTLWSLGAAFLLGAVLSGIVVRARVRAHLSPSDDDRAPGAADEDERVDRGELAGV
jgi:hypothetical protein